MSNRRQFLVGCSAAIASLAGGRVGKLVFADPHAANAAANDQILLMVFLRGGCDGLSLVTPYDDADYVTKRGSLAVNGALALGSTPTTTRIRSGVFVSRFASIVPRCHSAPSTSSRSSASSSWRPSAVPS